MTCRKQATHHIPASRPTFPVLERNQGAKGKLRVRRGCRGQKQGQPLAAEWCLHRVGVRPLPGQAERPRQQRHRAGGLAGSLPGHNPPGKLPRGLCIVNVQSKGRLTDQALEAHRPRSGWACGIAQGAPGLGVGTDLPEHIRDCLLPPRGKEDLSQMPNRCSTPLQICKVLFMSNHNCT